MNDKVKQKVEESMERMKAMVMKGASKLDLSEVKRYDIAQIHDPFAKPSTRGSVESDQEVWVEKLMANKRTGQLHSFFESKTTGRRVQDEPPTGASRVIYLRNSYVVRKTKEEAPPSASKTPDKKGSRGINFKKKKRWI